MKTKQNEENAKRIVSFFQNVDNDRAKTMKHFMEEGLNKRTIQRVLKRYIVSGRIEYNKKSGPQRSVLTKKMLQRIKKHYQRNPSSSVRQTAKKFQISNGSISNAKKILNIKTRKKKVAPKYIKDQKARAERALRKLYKMSTASGANHFFVLDDETYCPADPTQVNGNEYYNFVEGNDICREVKIKRKAKFYKKFMVWQAIAQSGEVSSAFITEGTMNKSIYLNECIKKILLPFIRKLQKNHNVLFWPDLATCHYSKDVQIFLKEINIKCVPRIDNPPNVPQNRPIERYWALCKDLYRRKNINCKSLAEFRKNWTIISKEIAGKNGKNLFHNFRKKLFDNGHNGL